MTFLSVQELVDLKKTKATASVFKYGEAGGSYYDPSTSILASAITEPVAKDILDRALKATLRMGQAKINRPWELIDLTAKLDPAQPWVGFEFETGFPTKQVYDNVINHVWNSYNHVAIDREGYGQYCPEITFSPCNLADYVNKTADLYNLLRWMDESGNKMNVGGYQYCGTHLNLSTPTFRQKCSTYKELAHAVRVVEIINASLVMMPEAQLVELFGRVPYGVGNKMPTWVEFKVFKSTDDLDIFDKYIKVSVKMAEVMEYLSRVTTLPVRAGHETYIHNLYEILSGKEGVEIELKKSIGPLPRLDGWRYNHGLYHKYRAAA